MVSQTSLSNATLSVVGFLTKTGSVVTANSGFFEPMVQGSQLNSVDYWPMTASYGNPMDYCGSYQRVREG
jgi:hypothetical protein